MQSSSVAPAGAVTAENWDQGGALSHWVYLHASYQWDQISAEGEIVKGGFGDQILYVHTARDVVIAYVGTNAALDAPPTRLPLRALVAHFFS